MPSSRRFGSRARRDSQGRLSRRPRPRPVGTPLWDDEAEDGDDNAKKGWSGVLRRWWGRDKRSLAERGDPPPGEDPVRRILSIPRGPARLDMFEETLVDLTPGTHGHRGVALAFHRELVAMAEQAGVDLALLRRRVEACADALVAADESERAGELLARIGKRHRAAELFVSAGAIDKLEEAHFEIEQEEGGRRLSARLAFEQFEARFLVGLRAEALRALDEAVKLWPENNIYREILDGLLARQPAPGALALRIERGEGAGRQVRLWRHFPLVIGRGEEAALRLRSPLLSRAHAEIGLVDGAPFLRAVSDKGGVSVDGEDASTPRRLEGEAHVAVAGVPIEALVDERGWIRLRPENERDRECVGVLGDAVEVAGVRFLVLADGRFGLAKREGVVLNGDRLLHETPLLRDDRIESSAGVLVVQGG